MDMEINIAIIGAVSAGKSTLLNALFVNQFSNMKIKRTTMTPQIYKETDVLNTDAKQILDKNNEINNKLIKKSENNEKITIEDIKGVEYYVPKVHNLVNLEKNIYLNIYDIPGLNDSRTKDIFYQYINNNFKHFDIIIFMVDINSGLNTSDEIDILNMITKNIKTNLDNNIINKIIVLANKCDELFMKNNKLVLEDEYDEMFEQIKKTVHQKIKEIFKKDEIKYDILPISCETAYIYRMLEKNPNEALDVKHMNKFGLNEFGKKQWNNMTDIEKKKAVKEIIAKGTDNAMKLCGFNDFSKTLNLFLDKKSQYQYINNHRYYDLSLITDFNKIDISQELDKFDKILASFHELNTKFLDKGQENNSIWLNTFTKFMDNYEKIIMDREIKSNNIENMNKIKEIMEKTCKMFNDIAYIRTMYKKIVDAINKYYELQIKEKKVGFIDGFNNFMKLLANKFDITKELILEWLSNDSAKSSNPKDIKSKIEEMHQKKIIKSDEEKVDILIKYLENIYTDIFNDKLTYDSAYLFHAEKFWYSYIFKSRFDKLIFLARRNMMFKFKMDAEFKENDLILERYLLELIDRV